MTDILSPDEQVERVRMALAEYGYPKADVHESWRSPWGIDVPVQRMSDTRWQRGSVTAASPPPAVAFTAMRIAGVITACWSCTQGGIDMALGCDAGSCAHPDADRWPPRELLVRGGGR